MKNHIIVGGVILFIVILQICLNIYVNNFKINDDSTNMNILNSHIYYYDNNSLLIDYLSKDTKINYNWNEFLSCDNNGHVLFKNKLYDFNSKELVFKNRRNILLVKDFNLNLDKENNIKVSLGTIDFYNNYLESNNKIYYKNKNISGYANSCYADLNKKNIEFKNIYLEF